MRNLLLVVIASTVVFTQMFCSSMNTQRIACEQGCKTSQNQCKKDADQIKNKAQQTAKITACDAAYQECMQKCNK
jgi:hypothetical protein